MKRGFAMSKTKKKLSDEEVARAIIALANLVIIQNKGHDIKLVKEQKK